MKSVCVERVKVFIDLSIVALLGIDLQCEINEHAVARINLLINHQKNYSEMLDRLVGSNLRIEAVLDRENNQYSRLFSGVIQNVSLVNANKFLTIMVSAISYSDVLDRERKSHSFQNINQTYNDIIQDIISDTENAVAKWNLAEEQKINRLIIQYEETDWKFIKRLSSYLHTVLLVDEKSDVPNIYLGIQKKSKRKWDVEGLYVYEKGIDKQYHSILNGGNSHDDFLYYSFKSKENYDLCDWFLINGEIFIVASKKVKFEQSELIFSYKIKKEEAFSQSEIYNNMIRGACLCGTVKDAQKENIYVQLDIDKEDNAEFPFLWEPVYGNLVYCMPECGERVRLYFAAEDEREVSVTHSIRENGGDNQNPEGFCEDFQKKQNRVFATSKDKYLRLYPNELSLESVGSGCSLNLLEIKDNKGISLNAPQKIELIAEGDIAFCSGKLFASAPQEVRLKGMVSSLQIIRDFNIFSPNRIENCGIDSMKSKPVISHSYKENRKWINNYKALASIPVKNLDAADWDGRCMCATASIPAVSDGRATVLISEMLSGKKIEDTQFSSVFSSMQNRTLNGGYPPPNLEE